MIVNVSSNFNNEVYTFLFSFEIETVYFIKKKIVISAKIKTSNYGETPSIHTEKLVSLWHVYHNKKDCDLHNYFLSSYIWKVDVFEGFCKDFCISN